MHYIFYLCVVSSIPQTVSMRIYVFSYTFMIYVHSILKNIKLQQRNQMKEIQNLFLESIKNVYTYYIQKISFNCFYIHIRIVNVHGNNLLLYISYPNILNTYICGLFMFSINWTTFLYLYYYLCQ